MVLYFKTGLPGNSLLQRFDVALGEVSHSPARRTDNMMVMPPIPSHQVALAAIVGVYPAKKAEVGQNVESPVDSHKTYVRILIVNVLVNLGRGQAFMLVCDDLNDGASLRRQFVAIFMKAINYCLNIHSASK
jgi:hypothetical protein